ncbi:translation initiation factor IF-2-like [Oenanthe melanoleuca]|uniref:translation initiation factor IF-2-like n=1 Tax=Oenanthe melanoleuca TaxID=2939378 RepID=UPI0024C1BF8B|nr:translation initiation factor IF-2-like [Oenanthe melanoleuca]
MALSILTGFLNPRVFHWRVRATEKVVERRERIGSHPAGVGGAAGARLRAPVPPRARPEQERQRRSGSSRPRRPSAARSAGRRDRGCGHGEGEAAVPEPGVRCPLGIPGFGSVRALSGFPGSVRFVPSRDSRVRFGSCPLGIPGFGSVRCRPCPAGGAALAPPLRVRQGAPRGRAALRERRRRAVPGRFGRSPRPARLSRDPAPARGTAALLRHRHSPGSPGGTPAPRRPKRSGSAGLDPSARPGAAPPPAAIPDPSRSKPPSRPPRKNRLRPGPPADTGRTRTRIPGPGFRYRPHLSTSGSTQRSERRSGRTRDEHPPQAVPEPGLCCCCAGGAETARTPGCWQASFDQQTLQMWLVWPCTTGVPDCKRVVP